MGTSAPREAPVHPSPEQPSAPVPAGRRSRWQRLIEPHPAIEEVGARHLARFLSSFLLVATLPSAAAVGVMGLARPALLPWCMVFLGTVLLAYRVSRSRRFLRAARICVGVFCALPLVATYVLGIMQPGSTMGGVPWVLLGILFGCIFFSARIMALVSLLCMAGVWALYGLLPDVAFEAALNAMWIILFVSLLAILSRRSQQLVEQARLALLDQRGRELVRLNRHMETMVYVISHDLKEPLRAIQGFSDVVEQRYADQLDDRGRGYLQRVTRAAKRMRELLDDVVQLLRAQRIEPPEVATPGDVIVQAALDRLENKIEELGARIDVAPGLPALQVDRTWGSAAVQNLVDNALKHTVDGARPEVEIAPYRGDRGVGLVVRDRGPGVPEAQADKIFDMFQRAVGRHVPGTGAGLAIVRQIARRHGGNAWVQPRPGGGSEFVITIQTDANAWRDAKESGIWDPLLLTKASAGASTRPARRRRPTTRG